LVIRLRELWSPIEAAQWPPEYSEGPSELRERMARLEILHDEVSGMSDALDAESGSLVD
jgi:hypothetical protein